MDFSKVKPMPERVILKISGQNRNELFTKKYVRPDGSTYSLIVTVDEKDGYDRKSTIFVRTAEVIAVGRKVRNIEVGDIAIMDYLVDNDKSVLLGWDGEDKYVSVYGNTTYYEKDFWAYADRKNPRDILVAKKGNIKKVAQILGVVRSGKIYANDPYVFLEYRSKKKETQSGLQYTDTKPYAETAVISVSIDSTKRYGIEENKKTIVRYSDMFDIDLSSIGIEGVICACNDADVIHQI